jgi:hypothetical protein
MRYPAGIVDIKVEICKVLSMNICWIINIIVAKPIKAYPTANVSKVFP